MFSQVLDATFIYMAVLLIAALSGLISEKAGVVNIGINGMMTFGALIFAVMGSVFDNQQSTFVVSLLIAATGAGLFALLHGVATIVFKADHVVSGTAINLLASGICLFLTPILAKDLVGSNNFQNPYTFFVLGPSTSITSISIVYLMVALSIAGSLFVYFKYTKFGKRHASVGENPNAADSAAINVIKYKWIAVFISGFLAGIAGAAAIQKIGTYNGDVQGLGFVALAIMILGQWRIPFIAIGSLAFAFLWGYASVNKELFGLPESVVKMIPFILSLVALVVLSKFQMAPKAAGLHFDKAKR